MCVCECVFSSNREGEGICGLLIGLGEVFQTLLVSSYLVYEQSARFVPHVSYLKMLNCVWLHWNAEWMEKLKC